MSWCRWGKASTNTPASAPRERPSLGTDGASGRAPAAPWRGARRCKPQHRPRQSAHRPDTWEARPACCLAPLHTRQESRGPASPSPRTPCAPLPGLSPSLSPLPSPPARPQRTCMYEMLTHMLTNRQSREAFFSFSTQARQSLTLGKASRQTRLHHHTCWMTCIRHALSLPCLRKTPRAPSWRACAESSRPPASPSATRECVRHARARVSLMRSLGRLQLCCACARVRVWCGSVRVLALAITCVTNLGTAVFGVRV
jgi:hypothetical protein